MIKNTLTLIFICFSYTFFGQAFTATWNTTNISTGSSAANEITIPTNSAYTYNYSVDWGDTNTDSNVTGNITHTYASPGTYTISLTGAFPAIYFNNTGDRNKIIEISSWGTITWQSMENAFYGCENLNFDAIAAPDLSQVTSLENMFKSCTSFNGIVNNWDVSGINNLAGTFDGCSIFNRPLDNWNTISVTSMARTFRNCYYYNEPLDNWNTSSVENMNQLFSGATQFDQNIDNWDVSQVTNMAGTFETALSFTFPLNNWKVDNVTDMSKMFYRCREFNHPLNNWNVSKVTTMREMFYGFLDMPFNQNINNWDVSNVTDMAYMFRRCASFNQPLNNWNVSNVTDMSHMFEGAHTFNQPIEIWNVSSVENMAAMFNGESQNMAFNQPLNNWIVSNVTNMSEMFQSATSFSQPLNNWDVSKVTNMSLMFKNADVFNQPLGTWSVGNVTNFQGMFQLNDIFNQPLNTWNLANATNISSMFASATNFNQPLDNWIVSKVTNMSSAFSGSTSFDQSLGSWNISAVTGMTNMLSNSGMSQANYDATLIAWSAQTVKANVTLGAANLQYCDALNQRQSLITDDGWTITGDSVNCTYVLCTEITMPHASDTATPANSDIRWDPAPNATGYRITIRRENGATNQLIYDNEDVGNVVGVNFTNEFTPGDTVYVTIVPYNNDGPATGCQEISFTVVESWVNSPDAFKLTYDTTLQEGTTTTPINQLLIQTQSGLTYNYNIDWGDGQYDNNVTSNITHTYLTPGTYTVSIIGTFPSPRHNQSSGDAYKLLSIDQWGTHDWKSMNNAFAGCENMEYNATDIPNLTNVTDMSSMFIVCKKFNGNINNWNVSNITNMYGMFGVASIFNQPLNNWDVSNVTNMNFMFSGASEFNQNINTWDVSSVIDLARMFRQATVFNQPLNSWNVTSATDMSEMFSYTDAFNQPLNNWQVQNVLDMEEMFNYAKAFNQNINSWNVLNVLNMSGMFNGATVFNQPLNSWNVGKVTTMASMFSSATAFNQPLNNWNVTSVATMASMFSAATSFNQNINTWSVTNVIDMQRMFYYATAYNQPLDNWNVDSVVNMTSMFQRASVFNQPLNTWNVSAVANMTSMFEDAIVFNQPLSNWDVSSVTLMRSLFEGAAVFNQNINDWNVGVVTTVEEMFKEAVLFNEPLNNWNTGEVLTMKEMFSGAYVFNQNIDSWNTSFVTTMEEMFKDARAYNETMNSWNVASVTTTKGMFQGAIAFNSAIDSWNVRKILTMENMFSGATNFNQTVNNWRVSGVTNMNSMLRNATSFNQTLDRWDIGAVTMRLMFDGATAYNQYLGDWDISGVTDMRDMLDKTALTRENYDNTLIAWSEQTLTPGVTLGAQGLPYCDALEERQSMITNFGWTISDDVLNCPKPECTQLTSPLNNATNVPVNTNLNWEPALFARGYKLTVISNPGNVVIVNNITVTDTSYEFASNFAGGETVLVTIIPFNDEGDAVGPCTQESFTISSSPATVPDCTTLTDPLNGTINVPINTDLSWQPISNADGYRLTIGTSTGGNQILDSENVGNVTTYDLTSDLPENTELFITVIPYNDEGNATGCPEERFTTEIIPVAPNCTSLTSPVNGSTNVVVDTDLSWNAVSGATGYIVVVGTTQGGIETVNNIDVLNTLTYNIPDDLFPNRTYYVTIIPYNEVGDAVGCTEESFRTGAGTLSDPPACTNLSAPLNNAIGVAADTNISWNAASNTTGYNLTIGTSAGASDILPTTNVGNLTTYNPPTNLPEGATIFVSIVPFNAFGSATGCPTEQFTITPPPVPICTSLISPLNGAANLPLNTNLEWTASTGANGYKLTVNASSSTANNLTNFNVTSGTTYNFTNNFEPGETVTVTITPYNAIGDAVGCTSESFTIQPLPNCTNLVTPVNGSIDVTTTTDIEWTATANTTGYRLTVLASNSTSNNLTNFNVTSGNTYNFPNNFEQGETVTITIVPYNSVGDAVGCTSESFTIKSIPTCTNLTLPTNGSVGVAINTNIEWTSILNANGYRLSVSASNSTANNLTNFNVTSGNTYSFPSNFEQGETVNITIVPYNEVGNAIGCTSESFTIKSVPVCTNLTSPVNGDVIVAANQITWNETPDTNGYKLTIRGSNTTTNDVTDLQVTGTTYTFPNNFDQGDVVTITIVPYNEVGDAIGCTPENFTIRTLPSCTSLLTPSNGTTNVPVTSSITWNPSADADGYRIAVGTSPSGTDIVNNQDMLSATNFTFTGNLPSETLIYVSITPYNTSGDAIGCASESFETEVVIPDCTILINPTNGETEVSLDSSISWEAVEKTDGYLLSIGTTLGGTDILDNQNMGSDSNYNHDIEFPFGTEIFVLITPYNSKGNAVQCEQQSFTTLVPEDDTKYGFSPNGDGINEYWHIDNIQYYPKNTVIIYNRWGDMVFKIADYNNNDNVFRGEANQMTKLGAGTLPSGTYFFDIQIEGETILKKTKGFVVIKR
ncbi:gliding motility-associated-like protein [Mariniflexile fucanivorans]|uniref:Gliding motility-associated-like protein n=1 Tax=Mariniflexile fucanivorans TaxID=264023 RepID=A0A4R1RLA2_9FLAO|nr:BspA family leucine-rich repeat surface protein [Mariniflexile fucanivorans]TCL66995.1 gliding motility-associated-like protein [Mariniflexile fucanivorans]